MGGAFEVEQDDSIFAIDAEHAHFAFDVADTDGRKIGDDDDLAADEVFWLIEVGDLGGRGFGAELVTL